MVKGGFAIGGLVSCFVAMGLLGGLVKAVKDKDEKKMTGKIGAISTAPTAVP